MPSLNTLVGLAFGFLAMSAPVMASADPLFDSPIIRRDISPDSLIPHHDLSKRAPNGDNAGAKCRGNYACRTSVLYARPSCNIHYRCTFKCLGGTVRRGNRCIFRPRRRPQCRRNSHCGNTIAHARPLCYHGQCTFQCRKGYHRSGGRCVRNENRCQSSTCAPVEDGYSVCRNGQCSYHCATYLGYTLFTNADKSVYKCIDLADDAQNCGSPGNVCKPGYNGKGYPQCEGGECTLDCRGYASRKTLNGEPYCTDEA